MCLLWLLKSDRVFKSFFILAFFVLLTFKMAAMDKLHIFLWVQKLKN